MAEKQQGHLLHFTYMNYQFKSVNSEFRSVDIDPNWGCLKWPYGTMSESPQESHQTRMDHYMIRQELNPETCKPAQTICFTLETLVVLLETEVEHPILSNRVQTRFQQYIGDMTRQNNQNTIGDVARRNNHKYCRRHGFGENTDCGNRGEIKSWCWGTWLSPSPFTRNDCKIMNTTACSTVQKIAGTFSPPCCLVFVGQDRQSWVPGPLHQI